MSAGARPGRALVAGASGYVGGRLIPRLLTDGWQVAAMARNAGNVTDYFNIPTNRVIELGSRVQI